MSIVIGYSGAREITEAHKKAIFPFLVNLEAEQYVTGACTGVDTWIGASLARLYPEARHTIVVPHNRSRVSYWWLHANVIRDLELVFLPPGTSYRSRNVAIVERSTRLDAFPMSAEHIPQSFRSGTWQTVRLARRAGLEVNVNVLNEITEETR